MLAKPWVSDTDGYDVELVSIVAGLDAKQHGPLSRTKTKSQMLVHYVLGKQWAHGAESLGREVRRSQHGRVFLSLQNPCSAVLVFATPAQTQKVEAGSAAKHCQAAAWNCSELAVWASLAAARPDFRVHGLSRRADPSLLDDFGYLGASGQQRVLGPARAWSPQGSMAPPHPGLGPERPEERGRGRRKQRRKAICIAWRDTACLVTRYGGEPCSGMRSCLGAEQCARTARQGGQEHAIARVCNLAALRGGASAVEGHVPCGASAPARCDVHAPLPLNSARHLRPQPRGVARRWPRTAAGVRVWQATRLPKKPSKLQAPWPRPRPPSAPGRAQLAGRLPRGIIMSPGVWSYATTSAAHTQRKRPGHVVLCFVPAVLMRLRSSSKRAGQPTLLWVDAV